VLQGPSRGQASNSSLGLSWMGLSLDCKDGSDQSSSQQSNLSKTGNATVFVMKGGKELN
jgi:hypothetical protein